MKKLEECKEYFKDLYMDCLQEDAFEKSVFESTSLARFEMFCDTLEFIYGADFKSARLRWSHEAANEFFA